MQLVQDEELSAEQDGKGFDKHVGVPLATTQNSGIVTQKSPRPQIQRASKRRRPERSPSPAQLETTGNERRARHKQRKSYDNVIFSASVTPSLSHSTSITSASSEYEGSSAVSGHSADSDQPVPIATGVPLSIQSAQITFLDGSLTATAGSRSDRPGPKSRSNLPIPVPNLTKKSRGRRVPIKQGEAVEAEATSSSNEAPPTKQARTYICQVEGCGKCFHRGEHLKRHIRSIHTHEKPYKCSHPACNKHFNRHDNLLQHLKVHKGREISPDSELEDAPERAPYRPPENLTLRRSSPPMIPPPQARAIRYNPILDSRIPSREPSPMSGEDDRHSPSRSPSPLPPPRAPPQLLPAVTSAPTSFRTITGNFANRTRYGVDASPESQYRSPVTTNFTHSTANSRMAISSLRTEVEESPLRRLCELAVSAAPPVGGQGS